MSAFSPPRCHSGTYRDIPEADSRARIVDDDKAIADYVRLPGNRVMDWILNSFLNYSACTNPRLTLSPSVGRRLQNVSDDKIVKPPSVKKA